MASHRARRLVVFGLLLGVLEVSPEVALAADPEAVRLSFSPAGEAYALVRREADVRFAFAVEAVKQEAKCVHLEVTPFVDKDGRPFAAAVAIKGKSQDSAQGFDVPAAGSVPAEIRTQVPGPGVYTSHLTLVYAGRRYSPVALTVTRPDPSLEVLEIPAIHASGCVAEVPITFRETTGQSIQLPAPHLIKLVSSDGQVKFNAAAAATLLEGDQAVKDPVALEPHATRTLKLRLASLPGAGQYEGTVRFSIGDLPPVDRTFLAYVKEPWWWAFLAIFAGVGLAAWLRWYLGQAKPRLEQQRRAQLLLQELDENARAAAAGSRELTVAQELRRQVANVVARLATSDPIEELSGQLDVFQEKVPLVREWIRLRRAVHEVEPASLRQGFTGNLDLVEAIVLRVDATIADVTNASAILAGMPAEMRTKVKEDLERRLGELDQEVTAELAGADAALMGALAARVRPLVERARAALGSDDPSAALRELNAARLANAAAIAEELATRVEGALPDGLLEVEWRELQLAVKAALVPARAGSPDVESAVEAVRAAQMLYLGGISRALTKRIDETVLRPAADDDGKRWQDGLKKIRDQLSSARELIAKGKINDASKIIQDAQLDYREAAARGPSGQRQGGEEKQPAPSALFPVVPSPGSLLRFVLPEDAATRAPADLAAAISRRIDRLDVLTSLAILLIASALGLNALWLNNLTWGSVGDVLTAFLWGLGLHQFSFQGIKGLMAQVAA